MNYLFVILLSAFTLSSKTIAETLTVDYNTTSYPRIAYAFGSRNHNDRYLQQILEQRLESFSVIDTLLETYADYDTTAAYDLLSERDGRCLISTLDRVVTQTFVFDAELLRSHFNMDSISEVNLLWKGAVVNRSQAGVYLTFGMYTGHLYGVVKGSSDEDSVAADTSFTVCNGTFFDRWARKECHMTLTFSRTNDSSVCEIQTDYLALEIIYEKTTQLTVRPRSQNVQERNGNNTIRYRLKQASPVSLSIISPTGELIYRTKKDRQKAGNYIWSLQQSSLPGKHLSPGRYFINVTTNYQKTTYPILLLQ